MKITVGFLEKYGACENQVKRFSEVFPDGAEVSQETGEQAVRANLNVYWLFNCLTERHRTALTAAIRTARDVYHDAMSDLYRDYVNMTAPLADSDGAVRELACRKYANALASVKAVYLKVFFQHLIVALNATLEEESACDVR